MQPKETNSSGKKQRKISRLQLTAILALVLHVGLWASSVSYRIFLFLSLPDWLEKWAFEFFSATQIEDMPRVAFAASFITGVALVVFVISLAWIFGKVRSLLEHQENEQ